MSHVQLGTVLGYLRQLAATRDAQERTDGQLLHAFATWNDQAAFAALVHRHGPMVLGVCRHLLRHEQDAEDAFQATFLVLARQAASIRKKDVLASWLHGVAYRTALKTKRDAARRRARERRTTAPPPSDPSWDVAWQEVQALLEEEIHRLPARYRDPFVLCCLEGWSRAEAARMLGLKEATVWTQLARARQRLRQRLAQRGITLPAVLGAVALSPGAGTSAVPAPLAQLTVRAALAYAAGQTAAVPMQVVALAKGVSQAMLLTQFKFTTLVVLALSVTLAGASAALRRNADAVATAAQPPELSQPPAQDTRPGPKEAAPIPPPAARIETEGQVLVSGQVLGPDGTPVAGAKVYVSSYTEQDHNDPEVRATSGPDGRFRFAATRWEVGVNECVAAVAEGLGPDWIELAKLDAAGSLPPLRLVKDDIPITGRVLDLESRPVAGATVRVLRVRKMPGEDLTPWIKDHPAQAGDKPEEIFARGRVALNYERIMTSVWGVRGTPRSVQTAADGRFRLSGFGRERVVDLVVEGPTIEHRRLQVLTRTGLPQGLALLTYGARFDHLAGPSKPISGTVREKGTGKPLAGVQVRGSVMQGLTITESMAAQTTTDAQGRYRLLGTSKSQRYLVLAKADGYFSAIEILPDTPGLEPITADIELERGVLFRGRLTDKATALPVRGFVHYVPRPGNPHVKDYPSFAKLGAWSFTYSEKDGSFTLVGVPGPGRLFARALEDRFVAARLVGLDSIPPPVLASTPTLHAIVAVDPSEKDPKPLVCDIALDPGRTITGVVHGPDGKPLDGVCAAGLAAAYSPLYSPSPKPKLTTAAFTAVGLDPGRPRLLVFWHEEKNLARAVLVRGDEPGPLTVRLEPPATITGRLLDASGRPEAGSEVQARYSSRPDGALPGELTGEGALIPSPAALPLRQATTGPDGRFRLEGLVAGMKYDLTALKSGEVLGNVVEDLLVSSDDPKDLGDLKAPAKPKKDEREERR
jgi:RNA polymerase sigma factor (sigma-70 family)